VKRRACTTAKNVVAWLSVSTHHSARGGAI